MIIMTNTEEKRINENIAIPVDNLLYSSEWSSEVREIETREVIQQYRNMTERHNYITLFTGIFEVLLSALSKYM